MFVEWKRNSSENKTKPRSESLISLKWEFIKVNIIECYIGIDWFQ